MTLAKRWLDAATILGRDPTAKVPCPVCAEANLSVRDVYPQPDAEVFERYLECSSCGGRTVMRMKKPQQPPRPSGSDGE